MHNTKGNMSGQHRRSKHIDRPHQHFHDAPAISREFWRLFWKPTSSMTPKELKIWLADCESHVKFYSELPNRDRGRRISWVRERRSTTTELKNRETK